MRTLVSPRLATFASASYPSRRRAEQRARRQVLRELDRLREQRSSQDATAYQDATPDWKKEGGDAAGLSALFKRDHVMSVSALANEEQRSRAKLTKKSSVAVMFCLHGLSRIFLL